MMCQHIISRGIYGTLNIPFTHPRDIEVFGDVLIIARQETQQRRISPQRTTSTNKETYSSGREQWLL